nr:senescence-associated carboxylesterase 101-like isoform X1 [Ipomoea batatas]
MSACMYRNSILCITFGSPLLGDNGFQEVISEYPRWNSSFLHVVYDKDPILFFLMSDQNDDTLRSNSELCSYRPFGTTLICSESGYSCFEDTESVLELMKTIVLLNSTANQNPGHCWPQFVDYGGILERLGWKMVCKGISKLPDSLSNPLQAGIVLQLDEIGIEKMQDGKDTSCLVTKVVERGVSTQHKSNDFPPSKIPMEMMVHITHLEWYVKGIEDQVGYYDRYKTLRSRSRDEAKSKLEIIQHHKILNLNWERIVQEAVNMLQKKGANFQYHWLYAGTSYRRIVEPLDIAEYYSKGKRDYLTQGRSEHYRVLEQCWKDYRPDQIAYTKRSRASALTEDSCFWAHVEEAIILCKLLKNGQNGRDVEDSFRKAELIKFEEYAMHLVNHYSVSYQIFWPGSTFMQWWREYCKIVGDTYNSPLCHFMKHHYHKYA